MDEIEFGKTYWHKGLKRYVTVVDEEDDFLVATEKHLVKAGELECAHMTAKTYYEMYRAATREEPEEYIGWAICKDCGKKLSLEDEPEGADWK